MALLPPHVSAQPQQKLWQKLATFPTRVLAVQFLEIPGPPRIGFVGCDNAVYRTTDGGETWREASYVRGKPNDPFMACDFAFKDSLTGWFANWDSNATYPYYATTDGGQSWTGQIAPTVSCSAIHYNPASGVLLLSGWPSFNHGLHSCLSTNEGASWQAFERGTPLNGYAFVDGNFGVATNYKSGYYQHTTDGGLTWSDVNGGANETWQPAADTANHTLWAAAEIAGTLDYSTDNGLNFTDLISRDFHTTGTLRSGPCGALYTQRAHAYGFDDSIQGIVISRDNGRTWNPLADQAGMHGPSGDADTRFFVKGSYTYAPSALNEVWRFIGDSTKYDGGGDLRPQSTLRELHIFANDCAPVTKPLFVRYLNDCSDAELTGAMIEPSDRFHLLNLTLPHTISGDYPITIEHDPLYHTPDTARLFLVYQSHGADSYDTVLLTNAIAGDRYTPRIQLSPTDITAKSGDTITVTYTLLDSIPASWGLDSIAINATFDSTALELNLGAGAGGPTVPLPFSLLREQHTKDSETVVLRLPAATDIPKNTVIASIPYRTYLTDQRTARYAVTSILFNDSVFNGCFATALVNPSQVTITMLGCGDSTAREFLRGEQFIRILRINAGSSNANVIVSAATNIDAEISVYNTLGSCLQHQETTLREGSNALALGSFPSGLYTCELRAKGAATLHARFLIVR